MNSARAARTRNMPAQAKETGWLTKPHEVRAILDGRKSQFRRIVKPQPWPNKPEGILRGAHMEGDYCWPHPKMSQVWTISNSIAKPNGPDGWVNDHAPWKPGDRLWVREAHYISEPEREAVGGAILNSVDEQVHYKADEPDGAKDGVPWRPSIHMPRWASRITLEVVSVRVEQLQEISQWDARQEGVNWDAQGTTPIDAFQAFWESINSPGSWDANPWVWVVGFSPVWPEAGGMRIRIRG